MIRGLFHRMFGSVRVRVAVVAGLTFAIALIAGSVLLLRTLETRLIDDIRRSDESALHDQVLSVMRVGLPVPIDDVNIEASAGRGTVAFQLPNPTGQTIVASAPGTVTGETWSGTAVTAGAPPPQFFDYIVDSSGAGQPAGAALQIDSESARLLGVAGQSGPFMISTVRLASGVSLSTASSLAEVQSTLSTTRTILWYAVPALVLLVAGCAWLLVGRALRPVHALTSRASTISARSLHERVPVPPVADEVSELATTINSMLDRIEAADLASRRLVSDASHELRTPITVIRTELEVARRDRNASWTDVSANVLIEVERLQALVDDLLLLARMSERGVVSEPFSVLDVVRDVAGRKRPVDVVVSVNDGDGRDLADVAMTGDATAVHRALDHVVANAGRHAASQIGVSVEVANGSIAIHVDDDGPGIPEADRDRVLQRFERRDEARSRDSGGSGLGLAVAADVAAAHGGSVAITDSPVGGARVSLLLRVENPDVSDRTGDRPA